MKLTIRLAATLSLAFFLSLLPLSIFSTHAPHASAGVLDRRFGDEIILDVTPPTSEVIELAPFPEIAHGQGASVPIAVRWWGSDDVSGVRWYDVQVRQGQGPWTTWLSQTTATEALYAGQPGHVYYFRTRSQDRAGNWEAYSDSKYKRIVVSGAANAYLPAILR